MQCFICWPVIISIVESSSKSIFSSDNQFYRKGSDPGVRVNGGYTNPWSFLPSQSASQSVPQFASQSASQSAYQSTSKSLPRSKQSSRTLSTSNKMLYEDEDDRTESSIISSAEPRTPPPVFHKIADFEKHYGTRSSVTSNTPTENSFRKRYIHRQSFPCVTLRPTTPNQKTLGPVTPCIQSGAGGSPHGKHRVNFDERVKCRSGDFTDSIRSNDFQDLSSMPSENNNNYSTLQCGMPKSVPISVDPLKGRWLF